MPDKLAQQEHRPDGGEYQELYRALDVARPTLNTAPCRLFPAAFDPADANLGAFPCALDWQWRSCEMALKHFNARGIVMRLPLFWQLETPLHAAGQAAGAPLFINDQGNMPVGAEAVRAGLDTVVTDALDAKAFALYLAERAVRVSSWILIHPLPAAAWVLPEELASDAHVAQEVHLFPGVPLLVQCPYLVEKKVQQFHLVHPFTLEDGKRLINPGDELLPPWRYALSLTLKAAEPCACGEETLMRADT